MATTRPRYSKDEIARRGEAMFERQVRPQMKPGDKGRFVALDIESGAYELGDDELAACDQLRARLPDAQIWLVRVGSAYVYRFGGGKG